MIELKEGDYFWFSEGRCWLLAKCTGICETLLKGPRFTRVKIRYVTKCGDCYSSTLNLHSDARMATDAEAMEGKLRYGL